MKFYVIAGEASGDLHGSNLIAALKRKQPEIEVRGWGGDKMAEAGAVVVKHYRELAFMGFWEVLMNIRTIWKNFKLCEKDIEDYAPDAVVLIDYPGFNLRMAKWAKKKGLKVFYYISPQVWAWKEGRVKQIKEFTDLMLVILPFEEEFYRKHQLNVTFVGHPLLDELEKLDSATNHPTESRTVALLPGSRLQEVKTMLPIMLSAVKHFPDYRFVVAAAPSLDDSVFNEMIAGTDVELVRGKTYEVLQDCSAALVTSGTATLEAGLLKVPQVVCYKGSSISFWIARNLVNVKYISLVNLIMDAPVVPELIQSDLSEGRLVEELSKYLNDEEHRQHVIADMRRLEEACGGTGASDRAAEAMLKSM